MKTLEQIDQDSMSQVVAKINGRDVTREELSRAFDLVADKANWKNPINAIIEIKTNAHQDLIREAVVFFTGSIPLFIPVGKRCRWRVRAAGYYATIGA